MSIVHRGSNQWDYRTNNMIKYGKPCAPKTIHRMNYIVHLINSRFKTRVRYHNPVSLWLVLFPTNGGPGARVKVCSSGWPSWTKELSFLSSPSQQIQFTVSQLYTTDLRKWSEGLNLKNIMYLYHCLAAQWPEELLFSSYAATFQIRSRRKENFDSETNWCCWDIYNPFVIRVVHRSILKTNSTIQNRIETNFRWTHLSLSSFLGFFNVQRVSTNWKSTHLNHGYLPTRFALLSHQLLRWT